MRNFHAHFTSFGRKRLQPFPQTFATGVANVCNRPCKRLRPKPHFGEIYAYTKERLEIYWCPLKKRGWKNGGRLYEKWIHNTLLSTMPTHIHTWNKVIHFCCSVSSVTEILYYISAQNVKMLKNPSICFSYFCLTIINPVYLQANHIRKWKIENVLTVIKKCLLETVLSIFYEAQTIRRHVIIVEENYGLLKNRYLLCTAYLLVF